jgi:type III secretory pathway component EscS
MTISKISQLMFGILFCGGIVFSFIGLIVGIICAIKTIQDIMEE